MAQWKPLAGVEYAPQALLSAQTLLRYAVWFSAHRSVKVVRPAYGADTHD